VNGSFETGDYFGWTLLETTAPDIFGTWALLQDGAVVDSDDVLFDFQDLASEPVASDHLPFTYRATDGQLVAALFQLGPDVHRLSQLVTIPPDATLLRWDMFYDNRAGAFHPAQQYLAIHLRDTFTNAVLATVYKTTAGADPLELAGMTPFSAGLAALAGSTVVLEIEAVVRVGSFPIALDNLRFE